MNPVQLRSVTWLGLAIVAGCVQPKPAVKAPVAAAVVQVADATTKSDSLASRVTRVTVYSDRARVTRQAAAEVPVEPTVFAFRGLPGWVDDGTVQVSVDAGRIVDVRVDRRFLAEA